MQRTFFSEHYGALTCYDNFTDNDSFFFEKFEIRNKFSDEKRKGIGKCIYSVPC